MPAAIRVCKKMNDFLGMVENKGVPGAWADYMFSEAQRS